MTAAAPTPANISERGEGMACTFALVLLGPERVQELCAADRFLQVGGKSPDDLLGPDARPAELPAEPGDGVEGERERHESDHRQLPVAGNDHPHQEERGKYVLDESCDRLRDV